MRIVSKLFDTQKQAAPQPAKAGPTESLTDGALDTLSSVIHVMGKESFPLEDDIDATVFPEMCAEFSRHVENGAAVPSFDIPASVDGAREWAHIRRFFSDRRQAEKSFVTERLQDYRGIVDDLVGGLREIGVRDQNTETSVIKCLSSVEDAVSTGVLPKIRNAVSQTVNEVNRTFAEQKQQYEKQLSELNERMSSLRQDLVAAREEMKRDPLTEAFNRGAFDAAIVQSLNMHFILQQPVTLIMIDLDNFKSINDTYGHAAGDEVLRGVGESLARSFIRKSDIIARYGGDEFAVILTDTSAKNALRLIETFLKHVREVSIPYADAGTVVSCSAGYTEIADNDTVESLVTRADKALYAAKAAGRDRAEFLAPEATAEAANH